jgi:hypothetical protein
MIIYVGEDKVENRAHSLIYVLGLNTFVRHSLMNERINRWKFILNKPNIFLLKY